MEYCDNNMYFIWGTGNIAEEINLYYGTMINKLNIKGYIDNNLKKQGERFKNCVIYHPDILKQEREGYLIIANGFYDDIINQVEKDYPWYNDRIVDSLFFERLQILSRYEKNSDEDIKRIIDYLKKNSLEVFNYDFSKDYQQDNYSVEFDREKELYFTMFSNKKMYFSRSYQTEKSVLEYFNSICMEQDKMSPHKYLNDSFNVKEGDIVIDAGVAEGNFALSVIDKVKKIYLFEPDQEWVEALNYTFEPYKDKVVIINKCLSNYINESTTTIDNELEERVNLLKMDIEGEEYYALLGAKKIIEKSEDIKCVVCTYHQEFAYHAIKQLLENYGFDVQTSEGYMWYPNKFNPMRPPVLRRGLVRAKKEIVL